MTSRTGPIGKSVHSEAQAAFCEQLITARTAAGLTQQDLAKRLRKPQSFVAKYEGGERRIDVVECLTITRASGADPVRSLRVLLRQRV